MTGILLRNRRQKPENPEKYMTLGKHLTELRFRVLVSIAAIGVASIAGWFLSDFAWCALRLPLKDLHLGGRQVVIQHIDVSSGFETRIRIALYIGAVLAMPVWLRESWKFLSPALAAKKKRLSFALLTVATLLFLLGLLAGWLVLPNMVRVLSDFQPIEDAFQLNARTYLDFAIRFTLAVGAGFTFPVFVVFLNRLGALSGKTVLRSWRLATLVICLFAAIATPAGDLLSMAILAVPLGIFYWIAAGLCVWHDRSAVRRSSEATS